jgi:hypothetical protein
MTYAAIGYVGKWTPGEIITDGLTDEQAERLLKKGAIRALGEQPAPEPPAQPEAPVTAQPEPDDTPEQADADLLDIDAAEALVRKPRRKGGKRG